MPVGPGGSPEAIDGGVAILTNSTDLNLRERLVELSLGTRVLAHEMASLSFRLPQVFS